MLGTTDDLVVPKPLREKVDQEKGGKALEFVLHATPEISGAMVMTLAIKA